MSRRRNKKLESILKSRPVNFIIVKRKKTLSTSLQSIIGQGHLGEMEEVVVWEDIESSTFINLMEFAYSGDYSIPRLSKSGQNQEDTSQFSESDSDSTESDSNSTDGALSLYLRSHGVNIRRKKTTDETQEPSSLHRWMLQVSKEKNSRQKSSAQYEYCQKNFSPNTATFRTAVNEPNGAPEAWLKDIQQQHRTGYEKVFMTHARLYIVASKFHIIELGNLCLLRIRLSLLHAPSTSEVAAAVFQITRVAYDKTNDNDPLRDLLIKFFITDLEWMMREEGGGGIAPLLRSVPGFAADLLLEIPQDFWVEIRDGGKA
ncbi:hypothetical protein LX32DRAFT_656183 [Colletotrichum zoysiae]|uniref:BTB domain-containing protein n=1 Tax=Colletotrichum zoysiae TaxID=1216348 RepID=A0AAD9H907_9PEZI|nr:hypothetical protein LX32DRAFT_656183 [Colletotrichum zoysiae]